MPFIILVILLAAFLAAGFYIGARALIEPQQPEFSRLALPPRREEQGEAGLRLLFFSDYHHPLNHLPPESLFNFIRETCPDAVVFGGDMASDPENMAEGQFIAARLAAFCADLGIPYLAIRGNHDDTLQQADDYPLLINQHYMLRSHDGSVWQIIGLEDIRLGTADIRRALQTAHPACPPALKGTAVPPARRIVLAHNPDSVLMIPKASAAFCLSGHFHGGQIKLPFKLEYMMLRGEALCRSGVTAGLYPVRGMWHFISRGWGEVLFPFRLGARPEASLLTFYQALRPADSEGVDARIRSYIAKHPLRYPYAEED